MLHQRDERRSLQPYSPHKPGDLLLQTQEVSRLMASLWREKGAAECLVPAVRYIIQQSFVSLPLLGFPWQSRTATWQLLWTATTLKPLPGEGRRELR